MAGGSLVALAALEGAIRVRRLFRDPGPPEPIALDDRLGWKATPGWTYRGDRRDASGRLYPVSIHVGEDGCRRAAAPPGSDAPRVLFVGDSFTHALEVSDDKAYWARFAVLRHADVRACGAGGYGTLQELMVLDDVLPRFDPATVVLQFSANDFVNNSYELEKRSRTNNNGMTRPYLGEDGSVTYRLPRALAPLREFSNRYLRSVYFLFTRFDRLAARSGPAIESDIAKGGASHPLYANAVRTTGALLERFRARVGPGRRFFVFSVDETPPFDAEFRRLAAENGISVVPGVAAAVRAAEEAGVQTRAEDGAHWNDAGHRIAADVLSRKILD